MTTSTQLQLRRGTNAQCIGMTPADCEPIGDTTNDRINFGNGSTPGGVPHANSSDIQQQKFIYPTVGGTGDAITLTNVPVVAAYAAPLRQVFKATANNTGPATVAVDGLTAKNIKKMSGGSLASLSANDIVSGGVYTLAYDGTQFQLQVGGGAITVVRQTFAASGTHTPSSGLRYADVEIVGPGGNASTGGGGAGGYCRKIIDATTIGAGQTVTLGTPGNPSTYGAILTANTGQNGSHSGSHNVVGIPGPGGTASGGDDNVNGAPGTSGLNSDGVALSLHIGSNGGSGRFGAGGYSGGENATGYGSGGGSDCNSVDGSGSNGYCVVTEYCSA